jgi:hypothetical protein
MENKGTREVQLGVISISFIEASKGKDQGPAQQVPEEKQHAE